ncbi:MAG: cytochrome C oxidase subunit IV family protein [Halobacteriovoraceae bacterium]|nr:cytochrome C oxidase subunit IV family protein [Halobacteriovoraceae bacterium]
MSGEVVHKKHTKEYMIIFVALAVLTVIEVLIPDFPIAYIFRASSLTLLAISKAFLVAFFYMHLKEETKYMAFLAAVPCVAAIYAIALMLETISR